MTSKDYARFLPPHHRTRVPSRPTWWDWRGRRVHIARATDPDAPVRVLVIHGAGGYSGALWPFAGIAAGAAAEVLAPDLPLYGDTVEPHPGRVRYETWLDLLCDLVTAERRADDRPLVLLGASMGGMLAYEVAARTRQVDAVVATCLLDPSAPAARRAAARFSATGRFAPALLGALDRVASERLLPIRWLVDMNNMSNNPALSRLCATDPRGGGTRVPIGFLASFLAFRPTAPETFDAAPVTLVHPAEDRWTPAELSLRFLDRIQAPTTRVLLGGCGHYPVEEPGITQLAQALTALRRELAG
ncbi:alpha/beta hydrolase [Amycolatopsis albispora]|uniref:Lysophospholipase n=1 Tax=Amycolatopsis albispora TaxID=1804986 RepID=A0A344LJL3_9PSEU|nr:alpha/beta hydrolase [Amycolatopsis albispora]AXB48237.1 lysophospholipase [Amycolatopsis albispora]